MAKSENKPVRNTQRGAVIWHGMRPREFRKLRDAGAELSWKNAYRILSTYAMLYHNAFWGTIEDWRYKKQLEETEIKPPIFVLGHWRSGTTLIHNLISLNPEFTYPNLYQCLFSHHFLTTESFMAPLTGWMIPNRRPMDNMTTGWKLPQEDEFALLLQTTYSPYRNLAFQGNREQYEKYFDLKEIPPEEFAEWQQALTKLMKKITIRENKPIVMKSPSHTYRVEHLIKMFPEAKFVYIYRHPYHVIRSTLHLRETMFYCNGLGNLNLAEHEDCVNKAYEHCIRTYEEDKKLIPEGQLYEVKFEEFEQDPVKHLDEAYDILNLPGWDVARELVQKEVAGFKTYKKNTFQADPVLADVVNNQMKFALDLYGYDPVEIQDQTPANSVG